tara:strand:+ start:996 stop:1172 length:177 start_codon:yes stop_codon:yes gene_type:complete
VFRDDDCDELMLSDEIQAKYARNKKTGSSFECRFFYLSCPLPQPKGQGSGLIASKTVN